MNTYANLSDKELKSLNQHLTDAMTSTGFAALVLGRDYQTHQASEALKGMHHTLKFFAESFCGEEVSRGRADSLGELLGQLLAAHGEIISVLTNHLELVDQADIQDELYLAQKLISQATDKINSAAKEPTK